MKRCVGEATMLSIVPKGLTTMQWVLIAFFVVLAATVAWAAIQDLFFAQRIMMRDS